MKGEGREQRDKKEKEKSKVCEGKEGKKIINPLPNTQQKKGKKIQELFLSQRLSESVSGTHDGFFTTSSLDCFWG